MINTTEQKEEFLRGHKKSSDLAKWPRKDEMTMVEKWETPAGYKLRGIKSLEDFSIRIYCCFMTDWLDWHVWLLHYLFKPS